MTIERDHHRKPTSLWLVLLIVHLVSCSETTDTETQIRAFIDAAEVAAEARDLGELRDLVASDYNDPRGNDKKAVVDRLRLLFLAYQSVHLAVYIEKIEVTSATAANVIALVGMADTTERLPDVDLYQFDIQLINDGDWRVRSADWQRGLGKPPG